MNAETNAEMNAEMNAKTILSDQPHQWVEHNEVALCILGTAHVSQKSADVVRDLIATDEFDAVAIELDEIRYQALTDKNRYRNMDLVSIIKNKQT